MSDQDGVPPPPSDVEFKGKTYSPLADGKYDYIILGTGLKESILSGLLSKSGKKVSFTCFVSISRIATCL